MEKSEAIELMKTSTTIEEWNENREIVKKECPEAINWIDTSGMVHETLKANRQETTAEAAVPKAVAKTEAKHTDEG